MNISNNLKKLRKERGWTQKQLAKKANVYYAMIFKIEQNFSKEPTIQTVAKIADALNVSVDMLIGRKFPKKT